MIIDASANEATDDTHPSAASSTTSARSRMTVLPLPSHPPAQRQAVLGALVPVLPALRFHPALACRDDAGRRRRFSALVAAVTGPDGALEEAPGATNAHRGQETER